MVVQNGSSHAADRRSFKLDNTRRQNAEKLRLVAVLSCGALIWAGALPGFTQDTETTPSTESTVEKVVDAPDLTDEKHKGKNANFWMRQKLRLSSEILAGLAESDFDKIGKNAALMKGLNRFEMFVRREPEATRTS